MNKFRVLNFNKCMEYFCQSKPMMNEIITMCYVNFVMSMVIVLVTIFKKPVRVVRHDDLT